MAEAAELDGWRFKAEGEEMTKAPGELEPTPKRISSFERNALANA